MNYYETLLIVHPALESGHLKDIVLSIEESLKNTGGKTISIELWGKKRLAYLIEKQKYGTYIQLQFTGEGSCTSNFGMELEHNPNILAYLTTSINEIDIVKQDQDLEAQIAGQTRDLPNTKDSTVDQSKGDNDTLEPSKESSAKDEVQAEETAENENLEEKQSE